MTSSAVDRFYRIITIWCLEVFGMVELHLSAASWFLGHYRIVYLLNTRPDLRSNRHLVTRSHLLDAERK